MVVVMAFMMAGYGGCDAPRLSGLAVLLFVSGVKKTAPERNGLCCLLLGFVVFVGLILKPMWGEPSGAFLVGCPACGLKKVLPMTGVSIPGRDLRLWSSGDQGWKLFGAFESQMSREASLIRAYADAVNLHKFTRIFTFNSVYPNPSGRMQISPKWNWLTNQISINFRFMGTCMPFFLGRH